MIEASIGELCEIVKGETGIMKAIPGQYPLVVTGADRKSSSTFQFDDEAVCIPLVSSTGHGHKSLNYVHYQSGKFALGTILAAVIPKDKSVLSAEYLQRYLQFNKDRVLVPLMTGAANVTLSMKNIAKVSVPIPSIEKQHNYIDLINRIENKQLNLNTEFNTQSSYLTQLRQAILQEAIEGKLTADWRKENPVCKGDPDYDAEALLKKIKAEKEKMVQEGKIKKQKPLAQFKPEEVPFELPGGWVWTRLGEINNIKSGKRIHAADYRKEGIPFLRSGEIGSLGRGECLKQELFISEKKYSEIKEKFGVPSPGDILIACIGGSIGNTWIVDERPFYYKDGNLVLIEKNSGLLISFLLNYLKSGFFWNNTILNATDTSYNALTIEKLNYGQIPLPPLAEQQAINERVKNLLSMIDELETQVSGRKEQSKQLLQAVLREAFEGSK